MKKKLIFVTKALWHGGIETALIQLLHALPPEKYDVTVLLLCAQRPLADRLPANCHLIVADRDSTVSFSAPYAHARLFHLAEPATAPSPLHRALMGLTPAVKWAENRLYIRYIRRNLPQTVYDCCLIYSDVAAETAVRAVNAKKYLLFYHHGAMRRVYHDTIGYRKSQAILAVSQGQAEKLRAFRPRYSHKVHVIPNLMDANRVRQSAAAHKMTVPEGIFPIVSCGRLTPEKGMDLAVLACARLVARGYDRIHWWIVGGGNGEDELRRQIRQSGMEPYMTVTGMVDDPYPWIDMAQIYVQPSRFESYSMTVVEALCLGKAIVSTDNGGAGEILQDGVTGILCPISGQAIADSVESLLVNEEKRQLLAAHATRWSPETQNAQALCALEKWL